MAEQWMPKSARLVVDEDEAQPSEPWRPQSARPAGPFAGQTDIPMQGAEASTGDLPKLARPVGQAETFAIHGANALPLGRPVVSGGAALLSQAAKLLGVGEPSAKFGPAALEAAREQGIELEQPQEAIGGLVDEYRRIRDERDIRGDVGAEEHPWSARAGTGTGILATALLPASAAAKGSQTLGRAMGTGALLGGAQAAGDSRADLTRGEVGRQLLDTGIGAALGAAGGAFGYGVSRALPGLASRAREFLGNMRHNAGTRALLLGADTLSNRAKLPEEAVQEAIDSGAIRFGGSIHGTSKRLARELGDHAEVYNAALDGMEELGMRGPRVGELVQELGDAGRALRTTATDPAARTVHSRAANVLREIGEDSADDAGRLGLRQAERVKTSFQGQPDYNRLRQNSDELNEALKEVASIVRRTNEEAVEAQGRALGGQAEELAEAFIPLKNRMGRLIAANDAAERGSAAASRRSGASLGSTIMAAGRTGNPILDEILARVMTGIRGRIPSSTAVLSSRGERLAQTIGRASQLGNITGSLPAGMSAGVGSAAGDLPALRDATPEERNRYEALMRALSK